MSSEQNRDAVNENLQCVNAFAGIWDVVALLQGAGDSETGSHVIHTATTCRMSRTPPLGNKRNPLNELAYIILSGQTGENLYSQAYRQFKRRFPKWSQVADATVDQVAEVIREAGLSQQKARYITGIARKLKVDFGCVSLCVLRKMDDIIAERYLCSLPGVGVKTARCVLMYSLGRQVFPADVHCLRIMTRLGWIKWVGQRAESLADIAQAGVPPEIRYILHVRLVEHGREFCRTKPRCEACILRYHCSLPRAVGIHSDDGINGGGVACCS